MLRWLCVLLLAPVLACSSAWGTQDVWRGVFEAPQTVAEQSAESDGDAVYCEAGKAIVHAAVEEQRVDLYTPFIATFTVDERYSVLSHTCTAEGFTVRSSSVSENRIVADLEATEGTERCVLTVQIRLQDGTAVEPKIYGFATDYGVFLSACSYDDARGFYLEYLQRQNLITEAQAEQLERNWARECCVQETIYTAASNAPATRAGGDTWVKGKLQWQDDAGVLHPLQYTLVEIWDEDVASDDLLGETFTDANGEYVCAFTNQTIATEQGGCDPYIRVSAIGIGYHIVVDKRGTGYDIELKPKENGSIIENVATGSATTINAIFTMANDLGKAFQILQAAVTVSRYVTEMDATGQNLGTVRIHYPDSGNSCYYQTNNIYITSAIAPPAGYPQSYAAWDVITHEYGHHVQEIFDITASPGG